VNEPENDTMMNAQSVAALRVLACPMADDHSGSGAKTVGHYLAKLVMKVWCEGECFNGKRPFGNSGWQWDLHEALIDDGLVEGGDEDDGSRRAESECDELIHQALLYLEQMMLNIPAIFAMANTDHGDTGRTGTALNIIREHTTWNAS